MTNKAGAASFAAGDTDEKRIKLLAILNSWSWLGSGMLSGRVYLKNWDLSRERSRVTLPGMHFNDIQFESRVTGRV